MKMFTVVSLFFALLIQPAYILAANTKTGESNALQALQFSDSELKNQDVLDMLKAGISLDTIIAKIKTSKCAFDISATTLQELKSAGVSEAILLAMAEVTIAQQTKKTQIKIPDNTAIEIENAFDLSSATVKSGDNVTFRVLRDVKINDAVAIEAGALVNGKVIKVKSRGRWGRAGKMDLIITEVIAVDGKPVPLKSDKSIKGEGNEGEVATKTIATAAVLSITVFFLTPLALLRGFKRGQNAIFPAGARFVVYVKGDAIVSAFSG